MSWRERIPLALAVSLLGGWLWWLFFITAMHFILGDPWRLVWWPAIAIMATFYSAFLLTEKRW